MLGLSVQMVASTIQTNVAGTTAAQFRERGNEYPVVVRLREADREQINDVGDVLLSTPSGQVVPAKNVMAVNREAGPVQIQRKNMERVTNVNAEIEVPQAGQYAEVFNSDSQYYGGSNVGNPVMLSSAPQSGGRRDVLVLTLPPLAALVLRRASDKHTA